MKEISTLIVWTDESRKDKIAIDIGLSWKGKISDISYDADLEFSDIDIDILVVDIESSEEEKVVTRLTEIIETIKDKDPKTVLMLSGKYSAQVKKDFKDIIDVFSGVTSAKIKTDYRSCIDIMISKKDKLNYYLTDFFAPHLVGDLERRGFELVLNETYDRESYKADFLLLWRSFMLIAPLLKPENREMLKNALHVYEERELYPEEKEAIHSEFFFMFNTLHSLGNFSERRLYYIEKSVISNVWESVIDFARSIDNSLLFGCHKSMNYVRLKLMTHKEYPLSKITKNSDIYKTLYLLIPYGDIVILSGGERMVIGAEPIYDDMEGLEGSNEPEAEADTLTFYFYIRVILPHRRHRGLKRF